MSDMKSVGGEIGKRGTSGIKSGFEETIVKNSRSPSLHTHEKQKEFCNEQQWMEWLC